MSGHYRGNGNGYGGGGHGNGTGQVGSRLGGVGRLASRITWGVAIVGVVVLTGLAAVGFLLVDPLLNLLAAMAGVALNSGKDAAALFGAGEWAGVAIDAAKSTDLPAQLLALAALIAKPLIVVGWGLGVAVLLVLPILARKAGDAANRWRG